MTGPASRKKERTDDLGFGSKVTEQSRKRFLNRDGTFNVVRTGLSYLESLSPYHSLLTISWTGFYTALLSAYLLFNLGFAWAYFACGPDALNGAAGRTTVDRFLDDFFFSVQTSTTIGYGHISPAGIAANILVSMEAMIGLLGFALATSLLFARFSKPDARIIFSRQAVVAPYQGITALEFRIVNGRSNQLIQVEATVTLSMKDESSRRKRMFYPLTLERDHVVFFPLNWTIVHPIDKESPLFGIDRERFYASDPEILILLSGVDEIFSQTVHARSSYKGMEIVWGAKFADMYLPSTDGSIAIDMKSIHAIEPVDGMPSPSS